MKKQKIPTTGKKKSITIKDLEQIVKILEGEEIKKTKENCYGFNVKIRYKDGREETRNNVTEIHYNYPSPVGKQIAFESDIHGTGGTVFIDEIEEFEAVLANKKEKDY